MSHKLPTTALALSLVLVLMTCKSVQAQAEHDASSTQARRIVEIKLINSRFIDELEQFVTSLTEELPHRIVRFSQEYGSDSGREGELAGSPEQEIAHIFQSLGVSDVELLSQLLDVKATRIHPSEFHIVLELDLEKPPVLESVDGISGMQAEIQPVAEQFLDAVIQVLEFETETASRQDYRRVNRDRNMAAGRTSMVIGSVRSSERILDTLNSQVDIVSGDLESLVAMGRQLEQEKQRLEMRQVVVEARRDAIARATEKLQEQIEQRMANDPVAAEFQELLRARERQLDDTEQLVEAGRADSSEVHHQVAALAESRARLAQRREEVSQTAGGAMIDELNQQLIQLNIEQAEIEAMTRYLTARLDEVGPKMRLIPKIQAVEKDLEQAHARLREAEVHMEKAEFERMLYIYEAAEPIILIREIEDEQE